MFCEESMKRASRNHLCHLISLIWACSRGSNQPTTCSQMTWTTSQHLGVALLRRRGQQWRHKPPMVLSWNSWNCPFTKRSTRLDFPTADSPKRTSLNWQILLPAFGPLGRVAPPLPAMFRYPVGRRQVTYWKAKQKKSKPQNDLNGRKRTGQRLQSHSNAGASQTEPEPDDERNTGCDHLRSSC